MFICTEFIEKTRRSQTKFWHVGIFFAWLGQLRLGKIHTFDGNMT